MTEQVVKRGGWIVTVYAALLILIGLALSVGGVALIRYGGSSYYLIAGVATTLSGVLLVRVDGRGRWAYGALLAGTLAWALAEVGSDGWALVPRLVAPFVLGLGMLLPPIRQLVPALPLNGRGASAGGWRTMTAGLVAALLLGFGLHAAGPGAPDEPVLRRGMATAPGRLAHPIGITAPGRPGEWASFGNDAGGTRFSPLDQINLTNVSQLEPAWQTDVGPRGPGADNGLEAVPLMVGDTLYLCTGYNVVQALDPDSGATRWRTDISHGVTASGKPCRGVAFYRVPGASGPCAERIVSFNQTPELVALDARTGRLCAGFGTSGYVSLEAGINPHPKGHYYISSAPQVIRGKVVVGGGIPDGQAWGGPSGVIRAFDLGTGRLAWAFDAGHPQRIGAPPPGKTYTPSSPNSWAPISADENLGLVYLPMGNATPDYFGAQRRPFDDAISSAVIALDADTGRLRWRFQTTHHDIWDYDLPSQPTLVDLPLPGGVRRALIQPTKRGEIFVLDRVTGRPIFPVREVPVPVGDIAGGERLSPTQPFSVGLPAFRGHYLREKDAWGTTPLDQLLCRIRFAKSRYQGPLTPMTPGKPVIVDPGYSGGVNWGSVSIDVDRGIMVVNWMQLPNRVELLTRAEADKRGYKLFDGQAQGGPPEMPMTNTPHGAYGGPFLSPIGTPCMAPPWGMIGAVDLATGKLIWKHPLGTARDSGPFGIPSMVPLMVGAPMTGGTVTTRGGLTFIAASAERAIRAIDVATGRELWKARLPAGGQSSPMTYRSPRTGRQYVVISAGGRKSLKTKEGHDVVAFALPRVS